MDKTFKNLSDYQDFFPLIAEDLEHAGLVWLPEIGDEIIEKETLSSIDKKESKEQSYNAKTIRISVLVDPQGLTVSQLRNKFRWLPTLEQLIMQCEIRKAILQHAGLVLGNSGMYYQTVLQEADRLIEAKARTLRSSVGIALRDLLLQNGSVEFH